MDDVNVDAVADADAGITRSDAEPRAEQKDAVAVEAARESNADILPVCFKAGSLGDNVPERDLWISPQHAMYFATANHAGALGGVLIEAKDLINGISIVQPAHTESVDYFHIELDSHDVIVAEGALSESFIDDDSRGIFHNAHEFETLYAEECPAPAHYCVPRLSEGYEVEAVRQRLMLRAGPVHSADATHQTSPQVGALRGHIDRIRSSSIAGWAQNSDAPEAPVCLDIFAGGKFIGRVLANIFRGDLKTAGLGSGRHGFNFTPPAGLAFGLETVEVRRSVDGARLQPTEQTRRAWRAA
jgi:Hint domain